MELLDIFYYNMSSLLRNDSLILEVADQVLHGDPTSITGDIWENCPSGYIDSTAKGFCGNKNNLFNFFLFYILKQFLVSTLKYNTVEIHLIDCVKELWDSRKLRLYQGEICPSSYIDSTVNGFCGNKNNLFDKKKKIWKCLFIYFKI